MRGHGGSVVAATLAATLAATAAAAQTLDGQVLLTWQSYTADGLESDGLRQRYDLRLGRALSDALFLRLMLRAEDDASGSTQLGEERTTDFQQLRPGAELSLSLPTLNGSLLWDEIRDETRLDDTGPVFERSFERLFGSLGHHPEGLPSLLYSGSRWRATDEAGADALEDRSTTRLEYERRGLRAAAYYDTSDIDDERAGFERRSRGLRGELGWGGSFAGDRLQVQIDTLGWSASVEERPLGAGADALRPVVIAETWQAIDDTPLDSTDRPLAFEPRLRDGDLATPAGVPLGPDAPTHRALAASFNRFVRVDELRIVARDAQGRPVTSGGPVAFDVYTSLDGVVWRALPVAATTTYDATLGLWSVRFERVSARWLKAVTFFVNTVATEATELQVFERRDLGARQLLDSDFERTSASTSITYRPVERFSLAWDTLWDVGRETPVGEPVIDTRDTSQTLTAVWDPRPAASLLTQVQSTRSSLEEGPERLEQGYDSALVDLRLGANPNLFGSLEVGRVEADYDERRLTTDRAFVRGYGRMWETLETTLDAGWTRQRSDDGETVESPSASALVRAELTRNVQLTLFANHQRNRVSGGLTPGEDFRDQDTRWWVDLFWRPSSVLAVGVRLGSVVSGEASTPTQNYRVEWRPFPGGALTLTALYDENVDPAFDRRSRRVLVGPRWRLNPRLTLTLDHYRLSSTGPGFSDELQSTFASLVWSF